MMFRRGDRVRVHNPEYPHEHTNARYGYVVRPPWSVEDGAVNVLVLLEGESRPRQYTNRELRHISPMEQLVAVSFANPTIEVYPQKLGRPDSV